MVGAASGMWGTLSADLERFKSDEYRGARRISSRVRAALKDPGRNRWCAQQLSDLPDTARILDIGCGYGNLVLRLEQEYPNTVGVDLDADAIAIAAKSACVAQFHKQDGTELPFEDGSFDVVVLSDVLEHVERRQQRPVIEEARRVVRDGGRLILTVPHTGMTAPFDPMDTKRRFPRLYDLYMRKTGYTPSTEAHIGHQHVSSDRLSRLLDGHFSTTKVRYCGFLEPFILWSQLVCDRVLHLNPESVYRVTRVRAWEGAVEYPRPMAYNIWITAEAIGTRDGRQLDAPTDSPA